MIHFRYDEDSDEVVLSLKEQDTRIEHEISPENLPEVEAQVQRVMEESGIITSEEHRERRQTRQS